MGELNRRIAKMQDVISNLEKTVETLEKKITELEKEEQIRLEDSDSSNSPPLMKK